MKFGVLMFSWEPFAYSPAVYGETAVKAEALGYDSFFVTDHLMRPFAEDDWPSRRHSTLEAWSLLAHVAAKTTAIKLGTCVTPLPMRHPPILAKTIATVDILSNGRAVLGVGAGYDEREFRAYGVASWEPAGVRVKRTAEALQLIRRLWTEGSVDFSGQYYSSKGAVLEPKPVQKPHPPIWVGAMNREMIRLTAGLADAWVPARSLGATPQFYRKNAGTLMDEAGRLGRRVELALMGYLVEKGYDAPLPPIGTFEEAAASLEEYKKSGCGYVLLAFFPAQKFERLMGRFQQEIAPSFT